MQYDLSSQKFFNNPFATLNEMRASNPVYKCLTNGSPQWYITRYYDCKYLFKDEYLTKDFLTSYSETERNELSNSYVVKILRSILHQDGEDHRRLRKLIVPVFRPSMMKEMEGFIESRSQELLDKFLGLGGIEDIISDYSTVITSNIIAKLLGIPEDDLDYLTRIVNEYLRLLSGNEEAPYYKLKDSNEGKVLIEYFDRIIKTKSSNLKDDVISELIKSNNEGKINQNELCSTLIILLIAGYETTANLIPNSIFTFLTNPEQWLLLQQHPEPIDSAIEECLRYTNPVFIGTRRWANQDIELRDEKILKGDQVLLVIGSANRDESIFNNAEVFNIARDPNPHLSFGHGPHLCLGNFLGRMEFKIILKLFLSKVPHMRLGVDKDSIVWDPHLIMRRLKKLPVIF